MSVPQPPVVFEFEGTGVPKWQAPLDTERCAATGCLKLVAVGLPYCATHLDEKLGVRIGETHLYSKEDGHLGVFATRDHQAGELTLPYVGEPISQATVKQRYAYHTAPYCLGSTATVDGALRRGIGAMVNHNARKLANAKFMQPTGKVKGWRVRNLRDVKAGEEITVWYGPTYILGEEGVEFETRHVPGNGEPVQPPSPHLLRPRNRKREDVFAPQPGLQRSDGTDVFVPQPSLQPVDIFSQNSSPVPFDDVSPLMPSGSPAADEQQEEEHAWHAGPACESCNNRNYFGVDTGGYDWAQRPIESEGRIASLPQLSDDYVVEALEFASHHPGIADLGIDVNTRDIFGRLFGVIQDGWFSDEIFNLYHEVFSFISVKLVSTYLMDNFERHGSNATKWRRIFDNVVGIEWAMIGNHAKWAIPINFDNNHWAMVVVEETGGGYNLHYHDSASVSQERVKKTLNQVAKMLRSIYPTHNGQATTFHMYWMTATPRQNNGNDCGAHALLLVHVLNYSSDFRKITPQMAIDFRRLLILNYARPAKPHKVKPRAAVAVDDDDEVAEINGFDSDDGERDQHESFADLAPAPQPPRPVPHSSHGDERKAPSPPPPPPRKVQQAPRSKSAPPPHPPPPPPPPPPPAAAAAPRRARRAPQRAAHHGNHYTKLNHFQEYCMHYLRIHNVVHQVNREKLRQSELVYLRTQFNDRKYYSPKSLRFRKYRGARRDVGHG